MADNAAAVEDDLSLPRAAVNKMIKEMIPMIRVSNDARELVLNCCTEFIHLIASEANEICNKQTKKTISPEHVIQALESLGFHDYVKDVEGVYQQFKKQAQTRKKNNKMKNQGVSEEELLRQQQALIAKARAEQAQEEWMHMQQHNLSIQQQQQSLLAAQQQQILGAQQPLGVTPQMSGGPAAAIPQTSLTLQPPGGPQGSLSLTSPKTPLTSPMTGSTSFPVPNISTPSAQPGPTSLLQSVASTDSSAGSAGSAGSTANALDQNTTSAKKETTINGTANQTMETEDTNSLTSVEVIASSVNISGKTSVVEDKKDLSSPTLEKT